MSDSTIDVIGPFRIEIGVEGFNRIIFDKRQLRKAIKQGGEITKQEARRLIASRAISRAGGLPGYDRGVMDKSIKIKVGSGGGYVKVSPYRTAAMNKATTGPNDNEPNFYPAYLIYGTNRGLKQRKDFMIQALENKRAQVRLAIAYALQNAIRAE
jgi:hypothetical protein